MPETGYKIPINVDIATAGAQEAATDVLRVGTNVEQLGEKHRAATPPMKNMGMAANAVSFQLQDFAVQVGAGQSAITAFAQQAPQLIGGLQMAGVMTGGVAMAMSGLAVAIPIVALGGRALFNSLSSGSEDAKKQTDTLAKSIEGVGKMMDEASRAEESATKSRLESIKLQEEKFTSLARAEDAAASANLSNAEKNRQAQNIIIEALGQQIDKYRELQAIADAQAAKLQLEAANQAGELQRGLQKDVGSAMASTSEIGERAARQLTLERELELEDQRLARLRAQNEEYTRAKAALDAQHVTLTKIMELAVGNVAGFMSTSRAQAAGEVDAGITGGRRASNEQQIARAENVRKQLLDELTSLREKTASDDAKAANIVRGISDKDEAVKVQLDTIQGTLEADTNLAGAKSLAASQKQLADDIDATLATIQAVTPAQQSALDDARKATADHKITSDEIAGLLRNLVTLTGGLQSGTSATNQNVQKLILIMNGYRDEAAAMRAQIETLSMKRR